MLWFVRWSTLFLGRPRSMMLPDSDAPRLCPWALTLRGGSNLGVADLSRPCVGVVVPGRGSQGIGDARASARGAETGVGRVEAVMLVVAVVAAEMGVRVRPESSVRADQACVVSAGVLPEWRREMEICFEGLEKGPWWEGMTRGARCRGERGCFGGSASGEAALGRMSSSMGL